MIDCSLPPPPALSAKPQWASQVSNRVVCCPPHPLRRANRHAFLPNPDREAPLFLPPSGPSDDGTPSAPPLPLDGSATAGTSGAGSWSATVDEGERVGKEKPNCSAAPRALCFPCTPSHHLPTPTHTPPDDVSLYRDLLRKARGDTELAGRWMAEIGATAPPPSALAAATARSDSLPDQQPPPPGTDLDAAAADAGAPPSFFCPISLRVMRDPVLLASGHSFDRAFVERWLRTAGPSPRCPASGAPLPSPVTVTPNVGLRHAIEAWAEKGAPWLLGGDGHVKPIPRDDDFSMTPAPARSPARPGANSDDLTLALRLQEEEMARLRSAGSRPPPGAGAPPPSHGGAPPPPLAWPPPGGLPPPRPPPPCWLARAPPTLPLYAITGAGLGLYLAALWKGGWQLDPLRVNPLVGPAPTALTSVGALDAVAVRDRGQAWRIPAAACACAGAVDAAAASSLVWALARPVTRGVVTPFLTVPLIFLLGSITGGAFSAAFVPTPNPQVGAPAGVSALLGATLTLLLARPSLFARHGLTVIILITLVGGVLAALAVLPFTNVFYLTPALATGAALALLLAVPAARGAIPPSTTPGRRRLKTARGVVSRIVGGAAVAALVAAAAVLTFSRPAATAAARACGPHCTAAACIPTHWWTCETAVASAPGAPPCAAHAEGTGSRVLCRVGGSHYVSTPYKPDGVADLCRAVCASGDGGGGGGASAPGASPGPPPPPPPPPPSNGAVADPSKGVLI